MLRFNVSQEDIDGGVPGGCRVCAVAVAMERQGLRNPVVTPHSMSWTMDGKRYIATAPSNVYHFVVAYDAGHPVEPMDVVLLDKQYQLHPAQGSI